jgi:hypothetical protein
VGSLWLSVIVPADAKLDEKSIKWRAERPHVTWNSKS